MRTAKSRAHSDARTQETWATIDSTIQIPQTFKMQMIWKMSYIGEKNKHSHFESYSVVIYFRDF